MTADRTPLRFPAAARAVVLGCGLATASAAQVPRGAVPPTRSSSPASARTDRQTTAPDSPRAALTGYLTAARRGDYAVAARYLAVPDSTSATTRTSLARELKLVLDRYVWLDLDEVSGQSTGDTTDELPSRIDEVAVIRFPDGRAGHVRLRRDTTSAGADTSVMWRFTAGTVAQIPEWYATLDDRWLIDRLPTTLLRAGPFDLLWWQWLAMLPTVVAAILIGTIGGKLLLWILSISSRRTHTRWDDVVVERLGAPLIGACILVIGAALVPLLELYAPAQSGMYRAIRVGVAAVIFWALWRLVDVSRELAARSRWANALPASRSLVPLGARVAKVTVAALGLVMILSTLGYPVASLVAGLGIGGLAVALAAQKTVENLFGAFSIGIDQPFREGDFVKVDDFVGTVEAIGLRSTRFRTLDRTIVTLPNGKLADMRLESFSVRDRLRLATTIGLVYETTPAQMRAVLAGFEGVLRAHPRIWPDAVVVRFSAFSPSSLDIEVMAWFTTADWSEFQRIREAILLEFMDVVATAGTAFAFPTTTVHLVPDGPSGANV